MIKSIIIDDFLISYFDVSSIFLHYAQRVYGKRSELAQAKSGSQQISNQLCVS
ncbi:MAG: hypothetical protein TRG1_3421 [Flavobacteriaceae bacterium FS1-H7996/R]|nr:MAG: hypothetical protein TRG1_3421 [Flavobacteriaceae bacterium FS1-H7996/R]